MSKAKQRRGNRPRQMNAKSHEGIKIMGEKAKYSGAARFIELAPPNINFRGLTNVDHITSITFANHMKDVEIRDEGGHGKAEVLDDDGNVLEAAVAPPTHMEKRMEYQVTVGIGGQQQEFSFINPEIAIDYYNNLLDQMVAIGVPCSLHPRIEMPKPKSPIVDADGKEMETASIEPGYEGEDLEDPVDPLIDELEDIAEEATEGKEQKPTEH